MRQDICETLNELQKPMVEQLQRETFIGAFCTRSHVEMRGKEKQDCFSFRSRASGLLLVFPSGGLLKPLSEHGEIFTEMLYLLSCLILTGLIQSTDISDFENGHRKHTRYKDFLNPSSPVDNNAGGRFML